MSHYILEGGPFARAFDAMTDAYRLPWTCGIRGRAPGGVTADARLYGPQARAARVATCAPRVASSAPSSPSSVSSPSSFKRAKAVARSHRAFPVS